MTALPLTREELLSFDRDAAIMIRHCDLAIDELGQRDCEASDLILRIGYWADSRNPRTSDDESKARAAISRMRELRHQARVFLNRITEFRDLLSELRRRTR